MKVPYALRNNKVVHISEVSSGVQNDCICPACGDVLVAKKGNIQVHHFSHYSVINCAGDPESLLHLLVKSLLLDCKIFMLPGTPKALDIHDAESEVNINEFRCDVLFNTSKQRPLIVEVFVTHKTDKNKIGKIEEAGIDAIELTVPAGVMSMPPNEIRHELESSIKWKSWLCGENNQIEEACNAETHRRERNSYFREIEAISIATVRKIPSWSSLYNNQEAVAMISAECRAELGPEIANEDFALLFSRKIEQQVKVDKIRIQNEEKSKSSNKFGRNDYRKAKWGG